MSGAGNKKKSFRRPGAPPPAPAAAAPAPGPSSAPGKDPGGTPVTRESPLWYGGVLALVLGLAAGLGYLTDRRVHDYRDNESIWAAAVRAYPRSSLLNNMLAMTYMESGQLDQAYACAQAAADLNPRYADAFNHVGWVQFMRGHMAESEEAYRRAVTLNPQHHEAWLGLAEIALTRNSRAEAEDDTARARAIIGDHFDVLNMEGRLAAMAGRFAQAVRDHQRSLALSPDKLITRLYLAQAYEGLRDTPSAIKAYQMILASEPEDVTANYALGLLLLGQGDLPAARARFEICARVRPDYPPPVTRLAWILAVQSDSTPADWARARELADAAVTATAGRDPAAFNSLSLALARLGRFAEALKVVDQAIQVAQDSGQKEYIPIQVSHRQLFQQHQPYIYHPAHD